ncbi:MAG: hypothetical protein HN742_07240 [Lentisphaerae bacterium]|jgi:hypothetical protein|nr:hypothetical protein [Lentisphaerota bacterium]MBT4814171.1 hypothetical protein [Lentisphaerota bacterium]MBT5608684.1 hypothetical protein [Lentisphaerota bacterium]MBT7057681.1 hypothetical protein [Lentisphaerota bacterium]MBT7841648.1 hypothetical protein [Lentisphaerota bacterium]
MLRFVCGILVCASLVQAQVERVWVTSRRTDLSHVVVCWETAEPGESVVHYGLAKDCPREARGSGTTVRHAVEVPLPDSGPLFYRVQTGEHETEVVRLPDFSQDQLRLAVVGNWSSLRPLAALQKDAPHILLTGGDNVGRLWDGKQRGNATNIGPYQRLIDTYPELIPAVVLMPVLGNHDREILPRGKRYPPEPTYDPQAVAFRTFFELPGDEWKWSAALPQFGIRIIALDLNHTSDMGTTWQTCHPFAAGSEQFAWFDQETKAAREPFVIALQNEQNSGMRGKEKGAWGNMFGRCNAVITGFGYYGEHAELGGTTYLNTSLSGTGAQYKDPKALFVVGQHNYLLLTVPRAGAVMSVALKGLDGAVLHALRVPARSR